MGGTRAGGLKAAAKNRAKNPNHYQMIGRKGGVNSRGGGFSLTGDPEADAAIRKKASEAGRKGGQTSRRTSG